MEDLAIIGVGMHPWGKWGRNFAEYGVVAIKEAMADAGLVVRRMLEPSPPPGFLERASAYEAAATIPRLLVLDAMKWEP